MNCNIPCGWPRSRLAGFFCAAALLVAQSASASLIPVDPTYPDIKTTGSDFAYTYNSGTGVGTLVINGSATTNNATLQEIRFDSLEPFAHRFCNGNVASGTPTAPAENGTCTTSATYYSLTATFQNGIFQSGTLQIGGDNPGTTTVEAAYIDGDPLTAGYQATTLANSGYALGNSGTILTATLDRFGFYGSVDSGSAGYDSLLVDFDGYMTGGDLDAIGNWVGLKWNGRVTSAGVDPYNQVWDNVALPFGQKSFNCTGSNCASQLDTFIPLPGALWLFGSGILGLVGVARRRKRQT